MKLKSILMATLFASAGLTAMSASAVTIIRDLNVATFAVSDGANGFNAHYGNDFTAANTGAFFVDKYFFSIASGFDSSASLTSTYLNSSKVKDLLITGFSLTKYDPTSMQQLMNVPGSNETASTSHARDSWSLTSYGLSAGSYFLKVEGNVVGNGGGTYGGDLTVSAVPEPETYAMLLAGLGLLGFTARRKAAKKAV